MCIRDSRIRADNQVPFDNGCFGCGKRSYLLGGLQLHISVRFYLAFQDVYKRQALTSMAIRRCSLPSM